MRYSGLLRLAAALVSSIRGARRVQGVLNGDEWAFLNINDVLKAESLSVVEAKYVRLGGVNPLSEASQEFLAATQPKSLDQLTREIAAMGYDAGARYRFSPSMQMYGVPLAAEFAEPMSNYCRQAVSYLYSRVEGLTPHNVDWTIIRAGEDYSMEYNQKGFIGRTYYLVYSLDAVNISSPIKAFRMKTGLTRFRGGANELIYYDETGELKSWHLFIGAGRSVIDSGISEALHLTTSSRHQKYTKQAGNLAARQAEEAVVHGITYYLATDLIRELAMPEGDMHLATTHQKLMSAAYVHVPAATRWVGQHGIHAAFDLYMDDPAKFMKAITS